MQQSVKITRRLLGGLAGAAAGLSLAVVAQAQAPSGTDCPDDGMGGMGWWIFVPILFAAFMLVGIFRMLVGDNPLRMMGMMGGTRGGDRHGAVGEDGGSRPSSGDSGGSAETPLEAAQRRYANGEINREEFQRIRDDLSQ